MYDRCPSRRMPAPADGLRQMPVPTDARFGGCLATDARPDRCPLRRMPAPAEVACFDRGSTRRESEVQALAALGVRRVAARMNLTYQARRRDALLGANVHSLNATTATPQFEHSTGDELQEAGEIAGALDDES
eukprot:5511667-Prymnesium_polylepis.1